MMRERRKIVEMGRRGDAAAMVTLVRVEGSSYRRVGARMLVAANGEYAGSISGGCLEAEVLRKAAWMVRGGALVERFSTLFDDTAEIPYGLGCGGTVDLLLEPAGTPEFAAVMEALEACVRGEVRRVAGQLPNEGRPLLRRVCDAGGKVLFESEGWGLDQVRAAEAFEEELLPPQRLLVLGAGDDAQPVVQMAGLLGWRVVVVDGRAQMARRQRFPEAEQVLVMSPQDGVEVQADDAVVVMTHSYEQDRDWLTAVLRQGPRYLGLLGARHRSALLVSEAAALLGWSVAEVCERLSAPVGLDLGGDGAEAIALAIVAEIHAACEGRLGAARMSSGRMTPATVAEQIEKGGASRYLQTQCAL
jgi:xanthine/CO dehydrogenase XdhC/CoxF family maturation factor